MSSSTKELVARWSALVDDAEAEVAKLEAKIEQRDARIEGIDNDLVRISKKNAELTKQVAAFESAGWRCCIDHLLKPEHPCPICANEAMQAKIDELTAEIDHIDRVQEAKNES